MKIIKIVLPLTILNLIALVIVTCTLPDIVPIHLNLSGVVDAFGSKWYILILGVIPVLLTIFYIIYTYYQNEDVNKSIEYKIVPLTAVFLMVVTWIPVFLVLSNSKSSGFQVIFFVFILIAILFIVFGCFMGSTERNKYFGIRTPWTLRNDVVWRKTNKLATYSFLVAGFVLIIYSITGFISGNAIFNIIGFAIALFLAAVVPIAYSYYEYKKINEF